MVTILSSLSRRDADEQGQTAGKSQAIQGKAVRGSGKTIF